MALNEYQKAEVAKYDGRTRVDLFKGTGKWYATCHVDMAAWYECDSVHGAVRAACNAEAMKPAAESGWELRGDLDSYLRQDWIAVCAEPHHQHAHPVLLAGVRGLEHEPAFALRDAARTLKGLAEHEP